MENKQYNKKTRWYGNFRAMARRVELNGKLRNAGVFLMLLALFSLLFKNMFLGFFMAICISIFIFDAFRSRDQRRLYKLHGQLIEFINHMIIMLRAGKTLRHIFLNSWQRFPGPLGTYLKEAAEGLEINPNLEEILELFEKRSGSNEVKLITSGLKINSMIGGDLISILNSISITLRESLRSRSRLNTLVLQSRYSANIISLFPIVVLLFLYMFWGDNFIGFFSTPIGIIILFIGGSLELAGIMVMKKIVRTEG